MTIGESETPPTLSHPQPTCFQNPVARELGGLEAGSEVVIIVTTY